MKNIVLVICMFMLIPSFYGQNGPGGVGSNDGTSNLEYWIDANNGISGTNPITAWLDLSGNTITNTVGGNPVLTTNALNGYDVVTFDGTGDVLVTNLSINESVFQDLTVIALYVPRINSAGGVWGEDNGGWDRFILDGNTGALNDLVSRGTSQVNNISNIFPVGVPVITSVIYREDVINGTTVYANNTLQSTFTSNMGVETSNIFKVGEIGANNYRFDGDIAELIVFGTNINSAQRIIIDNYLSAKYGLTLTSNDVFNEDDLVNGNYDHDVAGIGQAADGTNHTDSRGTGIVQILNPTDLNNDEFLLWGHDNALQQAAETSDVPASVQSRFVREWRVSEVSGSGATVDVGSLDIRFDLSGLNAVTFSDLRLLIDTDNDGLFSDETPIAGATDLGGNIYEFGGVSLLDDNLRFTIGTINSSQTPLPIDLLSFNARAVGDEFVKLDWQTASEVNNDFFTIERSEDGVDWNTLNQIKGSGNSATLLSYSSYDDNPSNGYSYYRLKQTDFDGQFSYSQIESVNIEGSINIGIQVFPNPAEHNITITGNDSELDHFKIYNVLGQDVTPFSKQISRGESQAVVDLSNLNTGVYYIKTKTSCSKLYKH